MPISQLDPEPTKRVRFARWALQRLGWEVHLDVGAARHLVAVVYPHTSKLDYLVLTLAHLASGLPIRFLMEPAYAGLPLLGRLWRSMGAMVMPQEDRSALVGELLARFATAQKAGEPLWLVLIPEGASAQADGWFDGFYRVATGAGVPVALTALDYGRKTLEVVAMVRTTDNVDADFRRMGRAFKGVMGYRPELASPVQPMSAVSFCDSNGAT